MTIGDVKLKRGEIWAGWARLLLGDQYEGRMIAVRKQNGVRTGSVRIPESYGMSKASVRDPYGSVREQ